MDNTLDSGETKKPVSRRRNRVPISCVICRRRKVKCDKQKPQCSNCIRNNVQHLCHYLEPKWAKPPEDEKTPTLQHEESQLADSNTCSNAQVPLNNGISNNETIKLKKELEEMKNKLQNLENENGELRKRMLKQTNPNSKHVNNTNAKSLQSDSTLDLISNSNILFRAQKGNQYNIPITYQISVFSWMFMVKNDLYLNDLWLKILKLRHHYECYYNSRRNPDQNMISTYKNYENKLSKFKNSTLKTSIIPQDKTNEHTSKLKKFLERSFKVENESGSPHPAMSSNLVQAGDPDRLRGNDMNHKGKITKDCKTKNEKEIDINMYVNGENQTEKSKIQMPNVCPVTGVVGVCPMGNSVRDLSKDSKSKRDNAKTKTPTTGKCPVIHSVDHTDSKKNSNAENYSDETLDDPKVCPLMVGDGKALFKEKLSKMNLESLRDSYHKSYNVNPETSNIRLKQGTESPVKEKMSPVISSRLSTPSSDFKTSETERLSNYVPIAMKPDLGSRQNSLKRILSRPNNSDNSLNQLNNKLKKRKTISPSVIKSLNYNNTKHVIAVIEQYIPNKKIVSLLVDRFFDKLYIHMPYVDEATFRYKVSMIMKNTDANQRIKLSSIGSLHCEEFLTLCLLLIIIRLSWLSLPDSSTENLSQNEILLTKPDNFVILVLVDMVKEVFTNAKVMTKPSIIIFQVALYLRIYSNVSPEDGFDTDDSYTRNNNNSTPNESNPGTPSSSSSNSNDLSGDLTNESPNMNSPAFISMLVQLAHTIGLNRDPLNFKNFHPHSNDDELTISKLFKKRHLWRKLWYGLLFLTIEANLSLGDYKKGLPIEIDVDPTMGSSTNQSWDCRLPGGIEQGVLEKCFESGKIFQRELCVVQNFRESINSYRWIYKGMKLLFELDRPVETKEVESVINKLNELICEKSKFGFGIDLIMGDQEIPNPFRARNSSVWIKKYTKHIKVMRLKVHLIVKNMIFTLNYLLFLNHEQKLSKLLAQKNPPIEKIEKQQLFIESFFESSLLSAIENFKLFLQFMDDSGKVFPNCGSELLIYPYLLILNHRSHEFLISLVLRVQQSSPVIIEILNKNNIDPKELQKRLFTYIETFIDRLDRLKKSYYYAWVLKRLVKFFYNILVNSQKFFNFNFKSVEVPNDIVVKKEDIQTKNGAKSAFQIAFGTSKLPPVTDFTHDDRREINFNTAAGDGALDFTTMDASMNIDNIRASNKVDASVSNDTSENAVGNKVYNEISTNTIDSNKRDNALESFPLNMKIDHKIEGLNEDLTEIFDDQFLNNIGGFAMENVNSNGFIGFNGNFNTSMNSSPLNINSPSLNINLSEYPSNATHSGFLNLPPNNLSSSIINGFNLNRNLSNIGGSNEIYNSLNEIDFTNVDLDTPVDNLVYGMDFEVQEATGNNSNQDHNSANMHPAPQSGLSGQWDFF